MRFSVKRWLIIVSIAIVTIAGGLATRTAQAQTGEEECPNEVFMGRQMCEGYLSGKTRTYGQNQNVFYDGLHVNDVNTLVSTIRGYLYDDDRDNNPGNYWIDVRNNDRVANNAGSATIIAVMMGKNGSDFNSINQGVDWARDNFDEWEDLVRQYDSLGRVQYNVLAISNDSQGDRVKHTSGDKPSNDNYFLRTAFFATQVIRFDAPNGNYFQIQRDCGNIFGLIGDLSLEEPPTGVVNPPTPPNPPNPPGYTPGDPAVYSSCSQVTGRAEDPADANYAVPVRLTYSINGSQVAQDSGGTASATGNRAFSRPTPQVVRDSTRAVSVTAEGRSKAGDWFALTNSTITLGPCLIPQPACGSFNIAPASIDPSMPYRIDVTVNYSDATSAQSVLDNGGLIYLRVNGPGVNYNQNLPTSRNGTSLAASASMSATNNVGVYAVRWGVVGPIGAIDCADGVGNNGNPDPEVEFPVNNKPYFKVSGGDVSAGMGMTVGPGDCTSGGVPPNDQAGIVSWNRNNSPAGNYDGAGTMLGALARGRLQEFATAQNSTGGADKASRPNGLSFSNANNPAGTVNLAGGLYGGKFDGGDCVPDYFASVPSSQITMGDVSLTSLSGFPAGGNIGNAFRRTYYVQGDLYVNSNVAYTGNYPGGLSDVPSFVVVVRGNIYIDRNVNRLDGFYIAQPAVASVGDSTQGNIYTCANAPTSAVALDRNMHGLCNVPLVVNGSFSARQVWLMRTAGTVSSSTAAETFNYVPDIWLAQAFSSVSGAPARGYDAITSLPPTL